MRTAVVLSAPLDPALRERIRVGEVPQHDLLALAEALDARLIAPIASGPSAEGGLGRALRLLRTAWAAFRQRRRFDLIVTDVDQAGVLLALMLKLARAKTRHVLVCHGKIVHAPSIHLLKLFRLETRIQRFVCYGPRVAERLRDALDLPDRRVVVVRHPADHRFWSPQPTSPECLIVGAGLLRRDYPTLIEAVRGMDVSVELAAYSPWVAGADADQSREALPPNVKFARCSPRALRDLYARALCVAVPLEKSGAQSGSLVVYEAMAMGKPVIVTATRGQKALGAVKEGETGHYIAPGDVEGWRRAIQRFLDCPEEAERMGRQARATVDAGLNMDAYVRDMVSIVRQAMEDAPEAVTGPALTNADADVQS